MKRLVSYAIAANVFGAAAPAFAQEECVPSFLENSLTVIVPPITASSGSTTTENFDVKVRNAGTGNANCPATLRIARIATTPSALAIPYSFAAQGRQLEVLPDENFTGGGQNELSLSQLPRNRNGSSIPMKVVIPSGWGVTAGIQVENLVLLLLDRNGTIIDRLPFSLSMQVAPAVEVRVVGATGTDAIARVDLGVLDPKSVTTSAPFGIRVWSTSAYTVSFQSENNGRLMLESRASSIDYQLYMDGNRVSTNGAVAGYEPDATDALGDFHSMTIRVEPFRARAGEYSDRVEVTVTAG